MNNLATATSTSPHTRRREKSAWIIDGYDGATPILHREIEGYLIGEVRIRLLLQMLAARHLDHDEIVDSMVSKRARFRRTLLDVRRDGHGLSFNCGDSVHFTARYVRPKR